MQHKINKGMAIIKLVHDNLCNRSNSVLSQNQAQHEVNLVKKDIDTSCQREQQTSLICKLSGRKWAENSHMHVIKHGVC